MTESLTPALKSDLFEYCLRLGDDFLILGHRLSEWCGHAPVLEEDIALANIGLDCLGQASALLRLAGQLEDTGRSEDDLAYFREATDFRNLLLVEQPNGDFAVTMARQFFFDVFSYHLYEGLSTSSHSELAGIAAKGFKEITYHLRHSSQWMLRLGDGTPESHNRVQQAVNDLWRFTAELFLIDALEMRLKEAALVPDRNPIEPQWREMVEHVCRNATLELPDPAARPIHLGMKGFHTEHLGHLLSEMQILARSYPGAQW